MEAKGFVSFHEHNEEEQLPIIISQLEQGRDIALVSDAGFPTLSDPGFRLIRALRKKGMRVSVVPGPSAILTALAASGLAPQPFVFLGFLPRKPGEQARLFAKYAEAYAQLGQREVCIARELTKPHEEFIFGKLGTQKSDSAGKCTSDKHPINSVFPPENLLGEITVVIGPAEEFKATPKTQVLALAAWLAETEPDLKPKDLARKVSAAVRGWTAKAVYSLLQADEVSRYVK